MQARLFLLALALGCTQDEPEPPGNDASPALTATLTPSTFVGTVATVQFTTPSTATAHVEVIEPDGAVRRFPTESADGTTHEAVLVGLAAGLDYDWRVVAALEDGGGELTTEPEVFSTAAQPLWLPAITVSVPSETPSADGFVLTTILSEESSVAILDHHGRYVWWWRGGEGQLPCQARMAADGRSLLVMIVDADMVTDIGAILRVSLTGETLSEVRAPLAHHDFIELEDGRIGYIAYDDRDWGGLHVAGDALVILDPETGIGTPLWSSWDSLTPGDTSTYPQSAVGLEWTHANGLAYDGATGDWMMSLHNVNTIVRLDGEGALRWQLGGVDSDFVHPDGETFALQHSPGFTPEGLLFFDNREPQSEGLYSRAVEVRLDEAEGTYETAWIYDGGRQIFTAFMGSAERLPDGRTLVGWGSGGRLDLVDPGGRVTWRLDLAIGYPLGFSHPVPTLGELPR